MSPDFTAFIGQLGIAAIFVVAWFREMGEKERIRKEKDTEIARLNAEMSAMQTQHRHEMLEIIRDIVAGRTIEASIPAN